MASRGVALVTGAGVRVGRAIALGLGRGGWDVAVHYRGSQDAAHEVVAALHGLGRRAVPLRADLAVPEAPAALVAAAREALGPLDALVASAATFVSAPLSALTPASFDMQMAVNARAPLFLAQAAAADLARAGQGAIVIIGDPGAERPTGGYLAHDATKAAVVSLGRGLARELAPDIRVNVVIPGPVALPDDWSAEQARAELARTPMGREGHPDDVAGAVRYLLSDAPYVTGAVLHVDGGRRLT